MIFKIRFGKWRLTITLAPVQDIIGVNSLLPDGNHILMWDFDEVPLTKVLRALRVRQLVYDLPRIYVLETRKDAGYIAYCLTRCRFMEAAEIISGTMYLCLNFFKWGVFRRRFTLRISHKSGRKPKLVAILESDTTEDVPINELASFVKYETLVDGHRGAFINLGARH